MYFKSNYVANHFYVDLVADPKVVIQPNVTYAAAPFGGVFTCSAKGYGNLTVKWLRGDGALPNKCNISTIHSLKFMQSILTIPNATAEDADKYYCIVERGRGKAPESATATLYISGMLSFTYHVAMVCVKLLYQC